MNTQDLLQAIMILLMLCGLVGGFLAYRKGYGQEASAIQSRVIAALKEEVESLQVKVENLEKERLTQDRTISTIRYALKQYGLKIVINGDFVTVNDPAGKRKTTRIQPLPVASAIDEDEETS